MHLLPFSRSGACTCEKPSASGRETPTDRRGVAQADADSTHGTPTHGTPTPKQKAGAGDKNVAPRRP